MFSQGQQNIIACLVQVRIVHLLVSGTCRFTELYSRTRQTSLFFQQASYQYLEFSA